MNQQPSIPQLPEMPSAAPAAAPHAPSAPASSPVGQNPGFIGTRRVGQIVRTVAGGGMVLIVLVLLLELIARPGLRPTDLMARMEAQTHLGILNQNMGIAPGQHVLNEAQYQEIVARAQRKGQADAELGFQRQLAVVQADKERVVGAYSTLYQRANQIAAAGLQMEAAAQQFRQQLLTMTNGGRAMVISIEDGLCALGSQEACQAAHDARIGMIGESDELSRGDVGAKIRALMSGIDDPATFVTHDDQRRNGTPALRR